MSSPSAERVVVAGWRGRASLVPLVKVCFGCLRVARADGTWAAGAGEARERQQAVTHGLCQPCLERLYGDA